MESGELKKRFAQGVLIALWYVLCCGLYSIHLTWWYGLITGTVLPLAVFGLVWCINTAASD